MTLFGQQSMLVVLHAQAAYAVLVMPQKYSLRQRQLHFVSNQVNKRACSNAQDFEQKRGLHQAEEMFSGIGWLFLRNS
jgi:hypothetical protein